MVHGRTAGVASYLRVEEWARFTCVASHGDFLLVVVVYILV